MMDEQNESEQDFRDEFTKGVYFSESDPSEDTLEVAYAVDSLAFDFYLKYTKSKGFSARKSKTFKNSIGEVYKQNFVCHRQDSTQFSAILPAHRKMSEADIMQMMNMLKFRISTSQIFGLLASQADGYEFIDYGPRDMYNEFARQRRQVSGNAARVLKKLEDMRLKDPQLYFKACHDSRGLFRNLFWYDGNSQLDYQCFGDVIAFDATYKKNKYSCPLVIFSRVNHHN
ncbi:hypothetical protein Ahy_B01g054109 isoform E [Arachis hypogaea]|uniref:Uncharacterized protein n=1 Tax=Arachis hypogaea TaxID=3818 RepID=A0A445ATB0_ARAHY|nr:hypothetical protein Ahy_B01g054109 isoform E [Arachis hypogaea]